MTTIVPVNAICAMAISWMVGLAVAYKRKRVGRHPKAKRSA